MEKIDKFKQASEIEQHLIDLIAKTNNSELMDVFLDWQNAREECNKDFYEFLDKINEIKL